jgi:hypothetical protein
MPHVLTALSQPSQSISFLDLPAEIRNHIYYDLLVFDYTELAPKRAGSERNGMARYHQMRRYKRQIRPCLGFLRVNKQVNREASPIFYGENEFRFTSLWGHDVLFYFCRTIGKANTMRLRKITQHLPYPGDYQGGYKLSGDHAARDSIGKNSVFKGVMSRMGLHSGGYKAWEFNIPRTITRLGSGPEQLRLVLPDTYQLSLSGHGDVSSFYEKHSRSLLGWMSEK